MRPPAQVHGLCPGREPVVTVAAGDSGRHCQGLRLLQGVGRHLTHIMLSKFLFSFWLLGLRPARDMP